MSIVSFRKSVFIPNINRSGIIVRSAGHLWRHKSWRANAPFEIGAGCLPISDAVPCHNTWPVQVDKSFWLAKAFATMRLRDWVPGREPCDSAWKTLICTEGLPGAPAHPINIQKANLWISQLQPSAWFDPRHFPGSFSQVLSRITTVMEALTSRNYTNRPFGKSYMKHNYIRHVTKEVQNNGG